MADIMFVFSLSDNVYPVLDWQRVAAKKMIHQFLNTPSWIHVSVCMSAELCRRVSGE